MVNVQTFLLYMLPFYFGRYCCLRREHIL